MSTKTNLNVEMKGKSKNKIAFVILTTELPKKLKEKMSLKASKLIRDEKGNIINYE